MAKLECHFFPGTPASWLCEACDTQYSEQCIPAGHSKHWGKKPPTCIRCNGALTYLGSATGAKPFWQMLPHFFAYPLHTNSLILIGAVAAGSFLMGQSLWSVLLMLFVAAVVVKYGFAIIEQRGSGAAHPPSVTAVVSGDQQHLFLKQIAVLFLMMVAVGFASGLSELLGLLVAGFVTLAIPASTMVLAVDKSVRRALNPLVLLTLMLAVGWSYLLLWVCVQIVTAGPVYVVDWLAAALPDRLVGPAVAGVMVYFTLVYYAMLGYVLFEYQSELGFESVTDDESLDRIGFEKARALGEATVLIRDGKYQEARESLRRAMEMVRDDVELHQSYHKLLMLLDDDKALSRHADTLIQLYQRQKQPAKAVSVLLDVHSRVPAYQLPSTQLALDLVPILQMQKQHKVIVRLFHKLHKTNPKDPLLPDAYLVVAQTFFEHLNDDAKALAITEFVLKYFPRYPRREAFEQLRTVISQPGPPGVTP